MDRHRRERFTQAKLIWRTGISRSLDEIKKQRCCRSLISPKNISLQCLSLKNIFLQCKSLQCISLQSLYLSKVYFLTVHLPAVYIPTVYLPTVYIPTLYLPIVYLATVYPSTVNLSTICPYGLSHAWDSLPKALVPHKLRISILSLCRNNQRKYYF